MNTKQYQKLCKGAAQDIALEYADMKDDPQLYYDLATCIVDNDDEGVVKYITKTLGVNKAYAKERLADDIYTEVLRAQ